jgi:hypothetical protein
MSRVPPLARFASQDDVKQALAFLDTRLFSGRRETAAIDEPPVSLVDLGDVPADEPLPDPPVAVATEPAIAEIAQILKQLIDRLVQKERAADELRRTPAEINHPPATTGRPIGRVRSFLEDVRARGFRPRGLVDIGANRGD